VHIALAIISALLAGSALAPIAGAGVLTVIANAAFVTGARLGPLSAVSVITSMFPAATVILARIVWNQRLTTRSALGLGAALVAVALIAI
jgi:drug/metabolite transporter (DMT)-like permease